MKMPAAAWLAVSQPFGKAIQDDQCYYAHGPFTVAFGLTAADF